MFKKTLDSKFSQRQFISVALILSVAIHFALASLNPSSSGLPGSQANSRLNVAIRTSPAEVSAENAKLVNSDNNGKKSEFNADKRVSKPKPLDPVSKLDTKDIITSHKIHNLASSTIQEKNKPILQAQTKKVQIDAKKEQADAKLKEFTVKNISKTQSEVKKIEASQIIEKIEQPTDAIETELITSKSYNTDSEQQPIKDSYSGSKISAQSEIVRYQIGSNDTPKPDYPSLAIRRGWQGEVILGVHVRADGSIEHLTFVKSTNYGVLNYEAYETVRTSWHFKPLEGGNSPNESAYIEVPIRFIIANR